MTRGHDKVSKYHLMMDLSKTTVSYFSLSVKRLKNLTSPEAIRVTNHPNQPQRIFTFQMTMNKK